MLSDRGVRAAVARGDVSLDPWCPHLVQPSSVDVRLSGLFMVPVTGGPVDPRCPAPGATRLVDVGVDPFVLDPGVFVLGATVEVLTLGHGVAAQLMGKSSLGRLGLVVHSTAGFIDPGFTGHITLELSNVSASPLILWPGDRVAQLCLFRLDQPAARPYGTPGLGSRYQGQRGPTPSRAPAGSTS